MDNLIINILNIVDISTNNILDLIGKEYDRDIFLCNDKYIKLTEKINDLKKYISSSSFSSLHNNAFLKQRFPLINLLRQILKIYNLKLVPMRESKGYEKNGKKKYRIFYKILYY